jgi:DNA-binding LytR/AlgR family response regulator
MRVVVVEDEPPARERLVAIIKSAAPDIEVAASLESVADTLEWLGRNGMPDLLFLDIQLSDGLSFDILRRGSVTCPVIFATAYDEYLLDAFETNGIDYLLKPIREEKMAAAIAKYRRLGEHFLGRPAVLPETLMRPRVRDRLLVRKGIDLTPVRTNEIAYLYTADKLVFLVTTSGARYIVDRSLSELENELDGSIFFRANRAWIINITSVVRCRSYGKGRLLLVLKPPAAEDVVVSQERAGALREWLGE